MTTHDTPRLDSKVQCPKCDRIRRVSFADCLRSGWPKCHGYTMTLKNTTADIGGAVAAAVGAKP